MASIDIKLAMSHQANPAVSSAIAPACHAPEIYIEALGVNGRPQPGGLCTLMRVPVGVMRYRRMALAPGVSEWTFHSQSRPTFAEYLIVLNPCSLKSRDANKNPAGAGLVIGPRFFLLLR